ncbi:flippase [Haloarcula marismortui]|uniref:flippase n=1 Tax=Haloarcula marismortui TaxID=2238 RepID=UPI003C733069
MNIGKASSRLFASSGLSKIIYLGATAFFASHYGPKNIGSFYLFESILIFTALFADLGIKGGIQKRISEEGNGSEKLSAGILIKSTSILATSLAILLLEKRVAGYIGVDKILIVIIAVICHNLYDTTVLVLRGEKQIDKSANVLLINRFLWFSVGFIFAASGYSIIAIFVSYIIGLIVSSLYGIWHISTGLSIPSKQAFVSIVTYARFNLISSVSGFAFGWLDVAMLGILADQTAVGLYETAWRSTGAIAIVSSALANTLFPAISEKASRKEFEEVSSLVTESLFASLYIAIPGVIGMILVAEGILVVIFGPEFTGAVTILTILALHRLLLSVNSIVGQALHAIDLPNKAAIASLIGTVANIVLNYVFILEFGAVGAAIATVSAYLINTVLHYRFLSEEIPLYFSSEFLQLLPYSLVIVGVTLLGNEIIDSNSALGLTLVISASGLLYFVVTLTSTPIRSKLLQLWRTA